MKKQLRSAAQQPHAAIGEMDKVHAPNSPAIFSISDYAPKVRRAVADAGRWVTLRLCKLTRRIAGTLTSLVSSSDTAGLTFGYRRNSPGLKALRLIGCDSVLALKGRNVGNLQDNSGRRISFLCGWVASVLMFGTVVAGVLVEARQLWRDGAASFMSDAGMRVFFGACIAVICAAPYVLVARAARKGGPQILFTVAAVSILGLQIWFMTKTLFFTHSSTAGIGLLFMPFYLCVPAVAIWIAATISRSLRMRRSAT